MTATDLVSLYEFSYGAIHRNLNEVTHEESLFIPAPAGNCINWALGHIVSARAVALALAAGGGPLLEDKHAAQYGRGSTALQPGDAVMELATLRSLLAESQKQLLAALGKLSDDYLKQDVPERYRRPPLTGNIGDALARLSSHEAYHNGQIGLLRRLAGKPGAIA